MEAAVAAGSSRYDFDKAASFLAKLGGLGAVGERGGWGGGGCVKCERCGEDSGFPESGPPSLGPMGISWWARRWGRGSSWPSESELDEIMNKVAEMSGKCAKEVKVVISPYGICPLGAHIDHQITDFGISAGLENSVAMLAVEAWGLKNCTQKEEWVNDTVTAVVVPSYIDSSEIVRRAWKRYNLSLGLGLNKVAGKVFIIGHLGNLNEDVSNCAEDYIKFLCQSVLENFPEVITFMAKRVDNTLWDCLKSVATSSFERITYTEALKHLEKVKGDTCGMCNIRRGWSLAFMMEKSKISGHNVARLGDVGCDVGGSQGATKLGSIRWVGPVPCSLTCIHDLVDSYATPRYTTEITRRATCEFRWVIIQGTRRTFVSGSVLKESINTKQGRHGVVLVKVIFNIIDAFGARQWRTFVTSSVLKKLINTKQGRHGVVLVKHKLQTITEKSALIRRDFGLRSQILDAIDQSISRSIR
ncbi:hypothetical protein Syun_010015 [Stephania yunnanensis]|uniref:Galactokinase N-terminal domain-containing protein n=1 Tax=Stephania yunnanensis TaxID=152371 RepID=A0AAP0PSV1_9MAGN